ncbi:cell division protein FtsQ/DivIB [Nocardia blacklockiae]|uniref:cell division protein FtsQ/DivIB n=1 Tax=Nocardia blacklockiae TaxID=480036 RepID=UPI00189435DF|nr:FtsQ-type POTRA domain-containing protein [Nocardia blacklockiae]MBF6174149.1 FtsQ-type POTRA domain-containing protein [Nocardia blacklockiae]
MRSAGRQRYPDDDLDERYDDAVDADDVAAAARRGATARRNRRGGTDFRLGREQLADLPIRRILWWGVPVVVALVVLVVVAYFTPLFAARSVAIEGLVTVPEQQVRDVVRIPGGRSMLRIDTDAVARRVAGIPKIHSARVQRSFPGTVRITVEERTPVLFYDAPDGTHLLDVDSVEYAVEPPPPGVPKLATDRPGGSDPVTRAAVAVLDAAPPELRAQVGEVVARSVSNIELNLTDGRTVLWGGADDSARKAAVVLPVLTRPGTVFDVSSPDLVTVK